MGSFFLHTPCDDGESVKETERSFERRGQTGGVFMSEEEEIRCVRVERDDEKRTKNDHDEAFFYDDFDCVFAALAAALVVERQPRQFVVVGF